MPTKSLDTLDGSQAWWQELGNRIDDAYKARKQSNQNQKDAALKNLRDFRDFPRLPQYAGLRQAAVDAITDFLLDDIDAALNGLSALEHGIQSAAQHESLTDRFVAESFKPRQHLLRALTSLAALQTHENGSHAVSGRIQPPASRKKLDQAVRIVGELLTQPLVPKKAAARPAGSGSTRSTSAKKQPKP